VPKETSLLERHVVINRVIFDHASRGRLPGKVITTSQAKTNPEQNVLGIIGKQAILHLLLAFI